MKTWLITGASRRFALEIAPAAHEAGESVVATARRPPPFSTHSPGTKGGCVRSPSMAPSGGCQVKAKSSGRV